jgi:hypothetical protein
MHAGRITRARAKGARPAGSGLAGLGIVERLGLAAALLVSVWLVIASVTA